MNSPIWSPSSTHIEQSRLNRFMQMASDRHGRVFENYDELWTWSVERSADFWALFWEFAGVIGQKTGEVLVDPDDLFNARFFPGAKLNFAENLLRKSGTAPAIIFRGEDGRRRELSWDKLRALVSQLQQALIAAGIERGDRIAGYLPHIPETIAAHLAAASLGAIWCSCSPDFGVNGLRDRLGQIEPRVLFCTDGYFYNGKQFDCLATAAQLGEQLNSIEQTVVVPFRHADPDLAPLSGKGISLADFIAPHAPKALHFEQTGFLDPLVIMFSSGTTGLPKCIMHSTGGVLLQHMKEHQLHCDIRDGDRFFYFTTCGWMMWNWQISALASGATLVLFDGSPSYPDFNCLAGIVEAERVTHFGTSAKYLDACDKAGLRPVDQYAFAPLRQILSTGSPLAPEGFHYVYDAWKADVCLSSIAGGTDILGCFVGGNPIGPVYAGQCQKRLLGMAVWVFDEQGNSLEQEPGELVCLGPHPSMPLGFWNDSDRSRYHAAYFEKFDNVWCHGDWVELTAEGGMIFHGRSDATLNPGGVRIGTAEIYRQVENIEEVIESVVIGQNWDNDVRVVLFVRLRAGVELDEALVKRIKTEIRQNASPRHVPARVIAVADIPRTRSGKITELAVRDVVEGRPVKNLGALANPEALGLYRNVPGLQE